VLGSKLPRSYVERVYEHLYFWQMRFLGLLDWLLFGFGPFCASRTKVDYANQVHIYRRTSNTRRCAMPSGIPDLGKGCRFRAKQDLFSSSENIKKQNKTWDLTRGGNSSDIAVIIFLIN